MDEKETQKKETAQDEADKGAGDTGEGDKFEEPEILRRTREERERLEQANKETARLLQEAKELKATEILGGQTGGRVEPEKKEETPAEYAKRITGGRV